MQATAHAHPNIAFIKYWGNADEKLRLPVNSSLSMNLDGILTETTVRWDETLTSDTLELNDVQVTGTALDRVALHLNVIRQRGGFYSFAHVESKNNFPMGAGIASSASAFAALTMAAVAAAGLELEERELTTLARLGSGSASRSIPAGFVQWHKGESHETSFAKSIASPAHWNLVDVIAIISGQHKTVGSSQGHITASTSELQSARVAGAERRLDTCKDALLACDFEAFAEVVEYDSNLMHAVMMTSRPSLFYWLPATLAVMDDVRHLRHDGVGVCYTLDAGPNVHCLTLMNDVDVVIDRLKSVEGVMEVKVAGAGSGTIVIG